MRVAEVMTEGVQTNCFFIDIDHLCSSSGNDFDRDNHATA